MATTKAQIMELLHEMLDEAGPQMRRNPPAAPHHVFGALVMRAIERGHNTTQMSEEDWEDVAIECGVEPTETADVLEQLASIEASTF